MATLRRTSIGVLAAWAVLGAGAAVPGGATAAPKDAPPGVGESATSTEAAAAVPVRTVAPARLERGPDARIPYLQDGLVHANEKQLRTTLPQDRKQVLLGRSGDAWLVAHGAPLRLRVHGVNRKRPPRLVPSSQWEGTGLTVRLARGGAQLVLGASRRGNTDLRVVRPSDGAVLGTWQDGADADPRPLDVADGRVVLHVPPDSPEAATVVEWTPGGSVRDLGVNANAAFLRRDQLLVEGAPGRHGPTSYAAPGAPAWTAPFVALDVSQDGRKVLGTGPRLVRGRAVLQVRRMSDGAVLQQFSHGRRVGPNEYWSPTEGPQTARFESNRRVVFEIADRGRATLVRCTAAGRCTRASRTGGPISTPFERVDWR